ncbi:Os01g0259900, partial [Oryza sativa Japonica Group]
FIFNFAATNHCSYEPGPAFEENSEEAMLDISQTESTELWLIQWPLNQLDASDFHGQELTLKLHRDGKLSSLESSSGKSYDLVSFAAQQPDATVFLPSGPEAKAVGKIARRVSLVRYPDPEELEKPGLGSLTPSSKKSAVALTDLNLSGLPGSSKKTRSRFTSGSKNRSSQGSAQSLGQQSAEPAHKHNQKRKDESSLGHSNVSGKSAEGSQVRGGDSGTTSEVPQTPVEKSKKKNKKVRIAE